MSALTDQIKSALREDEIAEVAKVLAQLGDGRADDPPDQEPP